jgi:hypothetical protein
LFFTFASSHLSRQHLHEYMQGRGHSVVSTPGTLGSGAVAVRDKMRSLHVGKKDDAERSDIANVSPLAPLIPTSARPTPPSRAHRMTPCAASAGGRGCGARPTTRPCPAEPRRTCPAAARRPRHGVCEQGLLRVGGGPPGVARRSRRHRRRARAKSCLPRRCAPP